MPARRMLNAMCKTHAVHRLLFTTAAALAQCGRSGHVQARLDGVQVSSRPSTPDYLSELCMPVAQVAERQHLRSASRNLLVAPRFQLNTYGRMVVVPLRWLHQQLGTHCRMNCETRISTVPPSDAN